MAISCLSNDNKLMESPTETTSSKPDSSSIPRVDEGSTDHDPHLYDVGFVAEAVTIDEQLTDEHVAFYEQHGYLAVDALLSLEQVEASKQILDDLITGKNGDWKGVMFEAAAKAELDQMTPDERRDKVRKLAFFGEEAVQCGLPVDEPRMMRSIQQLMQGREPKLFQTMTLLKPPHIGREKPWHQDHAYFNIDLADRIVGVWIALDEATQENGCMQLLDAGHTEPILHWKRRDWQICDTDMLGRKSVAVPLKPGGALFFDSLLPHGTPTNRSPNRRRAMQFHYAPKGATPISDEQQKVIFGTEGKDVEC